MHSHSQHRKHIASHRRAAQFMHENRGGACPPKKKVGGAAGTRAVHARGNDSEESMMAEGAKGKHRKAGGKVPKTSITVHVHPRPHVMMPAGAMPGVAPPIPPAASPGMPPGAGLPLQAMMPGQGMPLGGAMPLRKAGGRIHSTYEDPPEDISDYKPAHARKNQGGGLTDSYGSATGMSRRAEYRKMKGR
jgi:hypothetical protein